MSTAQAPTPAPRPRFSVGAIFRQFAGVPLLSEKLTKAMRRIVYRLMTCRTGETGAHLEICLSCGEVRPVYNSCQDRHCPTCQPRAGREWVEGRMATLLPISYFHTVFTIPQQLRPLFLWNPEPLYNALFRAVKETLTELAADPEHLGAQIGLTLVLHTWSRDLSYHPHIHCVVTGGGLTPDGLEWKSVHGEFLFPVRVMSALFQGKLLAQVKRLVDAGELKLADPEFSDPVQFSKLLNKLHHMSWVVFAKPPFSTPEYVYRYLSLYTHRVGISNGRLLEVTDTHVTFSTRDEKTVTLTGQEFVRRFLLHVLPQGFMKLRHYGLHAPTNLSTKLVKARALLTEGKDVPAPVAKAEEAVSPYTGQPYLVDPHVKYPCRRCGGTKFRIGLLSEAAVTKPIHGWVYGGRVPTAREMGTLTDLPVP